MKQQTCAWCEQEFGVKDPSPNASHGICARHALEQVEQMADMMRTANIPPAAIDAKLDAHRKSIHSGKGAFDMKKDGVPPHFVKSDATN
jgi:hypothetical protein